MPNQKSLTLIVITILLLLTSTSLATTVNIPKIRIATNQWDQPFDYSESYYSLGSGSHYYLGKNRIAGYNYYNSPIKYYQWTLTHPNGTEQTIYTKKWDTLTITRTAYIFPGYQNCPHGNCPKYRYYSDITLPEINLTIQNPGNYTIELREITVNRATADAYPNASIGDTVYNWTANLTSTWEESSYYSSWPGGSATGYTISKEYTTTSPQEYQQGQLLTQYQQLNQTQQETLARAFYDLTQNMNPWQATEWYQQHAQPQKIQELAQEYAKLKTSQTTGPNNLTQSYQNMTNNTTKLEQELQKHAEKGKNKLQETLLQTDPTRGTYAPLQKNSYAVTTISGRDPVASGQTELPQGTHTAESLNCKFKYSETESYTAGYGANNGWARTYNCWIPTNTGQKTTIGKEYKTLIKENITITPTPTTANVFQPTKGNTAKTKNKNNHNTTPLPITTTAAAATAIILLKKRKSIQKIKQEYQNTLKQRQEEEKEYAKARESKTPNPEIIRRILAPYQKIIQKSKQKLTKLINQTAALTNQRIPASTKAQYSLTHKKPENKKNTSMPTGAMILLDSENSRFLHGPGINWNFILEKTDDFFENIPIIGGIYTTGQKIGQWITNKMKIGVIGQAEKEIQKWKPTTKGRQGPVPYRLMKNFITPQNPLVWKVAHILTSNINEQGKEKYREDVIRLARFVQDNIAYERDYSNQKTEDFWQYPEYTLVTHKGDCEDQSLLLTSLLKSLGYPSRSVVGNVEFSPGKTEGHMWTEILIDGIWVPIEPTNFLYLTNIEVPSLFSTSLTFATLPNVESAFINPRWAKERYYKNVKSVNYHITEGGVYVHEYSQDNSSPDDISISANPNHIQTDNNTAQAWRITRNLAHRPGLLQQHHDTTTSRRLLGSISSKQSDHRVSENLDEMQLHALNHWTNTALRTTHTKNESNTAPVRINTKMSTPLNALTNKQRLFITKDTHIGGTRTAYIPLIQKTKRLSRLPQLTTIKDRYQATQITGPLGKIQTTAKIGSLLKKAGEIRDAVGLKNKIAAILRITNTPIIKTVDETSNLLRYREYQINRLHKDVKECYSNTPGVYDGSTCSNLPKETFKTEYWFLP